MGIEPEIRLHIDRLVIDAGLRLDGQALGAAVEAELTRLLTEHGAPSGLGSAARVAHLDGGRLQPDRGAGAEEVGKQVAQRVHEGLNR